MKKIILFISMIICGWISSVAQVGISADETPPDPSAMLDIRSSAGGLLLPRMTAAERDAIISPADALMIFNTTTRCFEAYNSVTAGWESVHCFICPLPEGGGPITGPSSVCDNSSGHMFSIPLVAGATGYTWSYSGSGFVITEGEFTNTITASFTGATPGTLTVSPYNSCGSGTASPPLSVGVDLVVPSAPIAQAPLLSQTYITWQWQAVAGATGYRWNLSDDYATSMDLGQVTGYSQIFLSCNTSYTIYIWAYNSCGYSGSTMMTATTYGCCGLPMTVTHLVLGGSGAPVNKTVTYETVSYSAGGSDKCWIARNLGASSQAATWDDATESAAGWYYQFNRKQGYKHDGVNRTPNSVWITMIDDNSNWLPENDPCAISFGANSGWRIPTMTEWQTVTDGSTSIQTDFSGPLKIHAAGFLEYTDGTLSSRGWKGVYWTSDQVNMYTGILAYFDIGTTYIDGFNKTHGFNVRCIRNF